MKKTLTTLSVAVLLLSCLFGCDNKETDKKQKNKASDTAVNSAMNDYLVNLGNLQKMEAEVYQSIENEDGKKFDLAVGEVQKEIQEALLNIEKINQAKPEMSSVFIPIALAKEKNSIFYHMPVIKHFAKAYDEALENKKNDAYNYLKNEIDEVEKNNILKRNNIKSLDEFKKLDGKKVSNIINSEPELYRMVSWKKIATDVGKAGVNAFVDAVKGDNPLSTKEIGKDYLIEKFKNSQEKNKAEIKIKEGRGIILGVSKKFQDGIDNIIPYDESVEHIITDEEEAQMQKLLETLDEKIIFGREIEENEEQVASLPGGDWNLILGVPETVIQKKKVQLEEKKTTEINPADFGLNEFSMPESKKKEEIKEESSQSNSIVGKWKAFNVTGGIINSNEYMKARGDQIPSVEFFEDGRVFYKYKDEKYNQEGIYTFDGKSGQINLGALPYMNLTLNGDELSSKSLVDNSSSNPITYHYKKIE